MKNIGFLISGSGTTLQNFIDIERAGRLKGKIVVVISSKVGVYGLERAAKAGIPYYVVEYKTYKGDIGGYSHQITEILKQYGTEIVLMGGFLSYYQVPAFFKNKVLNIHPALVPSFCGQGMYGDKVHRAVLDYGVKVTGCTVHIVDDHYDHGPILAQSVVEVKDDDTPESLAKRVQEREKMLYPAVVNDFIDGKYLIQDRKIVFKNNGLVL